MQKQAVLMTAAAEVLSLDRSVQTLHTLVLELVLVALTVVRKVVD